MSRLKGNRVDIKLIIRKNGYFSFVFSAQRLSERKGSQVMKKKIQTKHSVRKTLTEYVESSFRIHHSHG